MSRSATAGLALALAAGLSLVGPAHGAPQARLDRIVIDLTAPLNTFTPDQALGAAIDGMEAGGVDRRFTAFNIDKMKSAGLRHVSYRLRTELGIEAWHWSAEGTWSDPAHAQGYWTSSDDPKSEPAVTWGYSLPRRGDTVDQADDHGYSRIDDGDPASFWKSNPYLDARYTGAAARPQWIVVTLKAKTRIDAARIAWGEPYAAHFQVQYWSGDDAFDSDGRWVTFANGDQTASAKPDDAVLRLSDLPVSAKFLRILMLTSSGAAPAGSTDVRDGLGYAVREVSFGMAGADGGLDDVMRHGQSKDGQTLIEVSSTDPWHRAIDRNPASEQPSLETIFRTGLNGGLPLMVPVGVLYDTPENAAAEIRYVERRGWPVRQVELGEEPDGQAVSPEDYADLYLETAKVLRGVDPALSLGGPSLQEAITDTWPDPGSNTDADRSWSGRLIARLQARGALDRLQFFSFEHYPFEDVCAPLGGMLRDETERMNEAMADARAHGVPRTIPWVVSEYGFSAFSGRAMSDLPDALLAGDIVGHFLSLGGSAAYMFGYTPNEPINQRFPCAGHGNMMLFETGEDGGARWPMPVYFAEQMMMADWGAPSDEPHRLFAAKSGARDAKGRPYVVAYPLLASGGRWSVMLINRDQDRARDVSIAFKDGGKGAAFGAGGELSAVQYSPTQYGWLDQGEESHPIRDLPPSRFKLPGGRPVRLPPFSMTVLTGSGPWPPP